MAATIGTTFQSLIERVAQKEQVMESYTPLNSGTTTVVSSSALWKPNNAYQGMYLYVNSVANGTNAPLGEERQIVSSSASATSVTLAYALSSAVQSNSTFQIYNRWSRGDIGRAVNEGIKNSGGHWWQIVTDETITTNANTFSYSLASLSVPVEERYGVMRVSYKENSTYGTYPYRDIREWEIRFNGTTPTLQFGRRGYPVGRALRLEYAASPASMSAATDKTGVVDPYFDDFIVDWALATLQRARLSRAPAQEKDTIRLAYQLARDEAERTRNFKSPRRRPVATWRSGKNADDESSKWLAAYAGLLP